MKASVVRAVDVIVAMVDELVEFLAPVLVVGGGLYLAWQVWRAGIGG